MSFIYLKCTIACFEKCKERWNVETEYFIDFLFQLMFIIMSRKVRLNKLFSRWKWNICWPISTDASATQPCGTQKKESKNEDGFSFSKNILLYHYFSFSPLQKRYVYVLRQVRENWWMNVLVYLIALTFFK